MLLVNPKASFKLDKKVPSPFHKEVVGGSKPPTTSLWDLVVKVEPRKIRLKQFSSFFTYALSAANLDVRVSARGNSSNQSESL